MMLRSQRDDGSLPLTLLVTIVVGGAVVVLFSIVQSSIQSSARDRDFGQAIQIADAGVQEAYVLVGEAIETSDFSELIGCEQPTWFAEDFGANDPSRGACVGSLGEESEFDWSYECAGSDCDVLAVGRYRGSARAVQISVSELLSSEAGLIGEDVDSKGGGNPTGAVFAIGTFKCVDLPSSNPHIVSRIEYYGEDFQADRNECWNLRGADPEIVVMDPPDRPDTAALACDGQTVYDDLDAWSGTVEHGTSVCVQRAVLDGIEIPGEGDGADIYVLGGGPTGNGNGGGNAADSVSVGGHERVNENGPSSNLRVYVSAGRVSFNQQAYVAMQLYAPNSQCLWGPANSSQGAGYRGTAFCRELRFNGALTVEGTDDSALRTEPTIGTWTEERVPAGRGVGVAAGP